jgi:predicted short-subunit dehydrogenase-like oxidoreductase (DUF2520 family)
VLVVLSTTIGRFCANSAAFAAREEAKMNCSNIKENKARKAKDFLAKVKKLRPKNLDSFFFKSFEQAEIGI